ncbi:MAG TPA: 23S rRNA (uracil(1939)-C(5))-methyltransferase RlmD [Myxococcota bacterium]|nr:23S rRNA (uracil(1939)-C(5))-methyltransferase RlmD [Myxococcota bacterium]
MPEPRIPCPHFPDCVGCPWVAAPYPEQLARKEARVRDALGRHASLSRVAQLPLRPAPRPFGYRQTVKLVARRGREGLRLGVYRPGTHDVADIRRCAAHHPAANETLAPLVSILERLRIPTYDEQRRTGWLRYVIVRVGAERRVQIVLVVRELGHAAERELVRALAGLRGVAGVVLNVNDDPGNALFGERFAVASGEAALVDEVGELALRSSAGSFVQANPPAARRAYETVLRLADPKPGMRALDLYCGVGAISLLLARAGAAVTGVEESPRAVRDARANARENGVAEVRFEEGDAAQALARFTREGLRPDLITLNPPRRGAAPEVREAIAQLAPQRIVYLSCDPDTLARDLDDLAQRGFAARSVEPFDFLPHTEHVETVAVAERV